MSAASSPFKQFPSLEQLAKRLAQLEHLNKNLVGIIADLELRNLFVMSKVVLARQRHGGLILDGKPQVEQLTLMQLFDDEKESFIAMLREQEEQRGADIRAIEAHAERLARVRADAERTQTDVPKNPIDPVDPVDRDALDAFTPEAPASASADR